jgi:lipid-binding SYLF domain-containing protein
MEYRMKNTLIAFLALSLALTTSFVHGWDPDDSDKLELSVAQAILEAKKKDPLIAKWFDAAYAYAVFPKIGKGGFIVGGAYGKGLVIQGDSTIGTTSLTQGSIGAQIGGQAYAEYIMFRDETALNHFRRGNFEMGAQASAVAITLGASTDANYDSGVAIFTLPMGGLMAEASVGGQKFKYKDK